MKTVTVKQSELQEVETNLKKGVVYGNHNFSFIYKSGSQTERPLYWMIDIVNDKNKFFNNMKSFASAIVYFFCPRTSWFFQNHKSVLPLNIKTIIL